jgi:energy-coupling factor transport system ATP-binding protein
MIYFENVSYSRAKTEIIKSISFRIRRGDFVSLIGANGAGKSTLMRLCNGLLKPSSGTVKVCDLDTSVSKTSSIAKFAGFLFQNPDMQICRNTAREEIMFGLMCVLKDKREIKRRCENTLMKFGFNGDTPPFTMSRGERQRLALASLLATEPELMLLDEPTTGLDHRESIEIMKCIKASSENGTTVLMVSHDMEIVHDFAEEVMVLNGGCLLAKGSAKEILRERTLLAEASLLPPQITDLSLRLGEGFEDVSTVEEMVSAVEKKHRRKQDERFF